MTVERFREAFPRARWRDDLGAWFVLSSRAERRLKSRMTHAGWVVFEAVTGELVEPVIAARFYPGVSPGPAALIWAAWRRPSHAELVAAWPARTPPGPSDLARGWWQPMIDVLREERRKAASLELSPASRRKSG